MSSKFIGGRDYAGRGGILIEDHNGSFARMVREAPKELRRRMSTTVLQTASKLAQRIARTAPKGPESPHIQDTVTFSHRGLTARVGYIAEDFGAQQAAEGSSATIAEVALYNEYKPNKQPFMRPAAEAQSSDFVKLTEDAIASMERALSGGFGTPFKL